MQPVYPGEFIYDLNQVPTDMLVKILTYVEDPTTTFVSKWFAECNITAIKECQVQQIKRFTCSISQDIDIIIKNENTRSKPKQELIDTWTKCQQSILNVDGANILKAKNLQQVISAVYDLEYPMMKTLTSLPHHYSSFCGNFKRNFKQIYEAPSNIPKLFQNILFMASIYTDETKSSSHIALKLATRAPSCFTAWGKNKIAEQVTDDALKLVTSSDQKTIDAREALNEIIYSYCLLEKFDKADEVQVLSNAIYGHGYDGSQYCRNKILNGQKQQLMTELCTVKRLIDRDFTDTTSL